MTYESLSDDDLRAIGDGLLRQIDADELADIEKAAKAQPDLKVAEVNDGYGHAWTELIHKDDKAGAGIAETVLDYAVSFDPEIAAFLASAKPTILDLCARIHRLMRVIESHEAGTPLEDK